jgi:hypothetical protein
MEIIDNQALYVSISSNQFQAAYNKALSSLKSDDFSHGLNFEKLNNSPLSSIRLGRGRRLLLAKVQRKITEEGIEKEVECWLPLEFHESHDQYEEAIKKYKRPLALNSKIKREINSIELAQNNVSEGRAVLPPPENTAPDVAEAPVIELTFYDQLVNLDAEQQKAVETKFPCLITGFAGSGKTLVALSIIERLFDELDTEGDPLLYIAPTKALAEHMKELWAGLPASQTTNRELRCVSFDELLEDAYPKQGIVDDQYLENWIKTNAEKYSLKEKVDASKKIIEEFKLISGLSEGDYLKLGNRNSYFERSDREKIFQFYKAYRDALNNDGKIHSRFTALPKGYLDSYSAFIVDEVQNYAPGSLSGMAKRPVCLLGDSNQAPGALPVMTHIKEKLADGRSINLPWVHRSPVAVTAVLNKLLEVRSKMLGGWLERDKKEQKEGDLSIQTPKDALTGVVLHYDDAMQCRLQYFKDKPLGPDTVIITDAKHVEEAKEKFGTLLVFTPEQTVGLDYPNVVLYRLFEPQNTWVKEIYEHYKKNGRESNTNRASKEILKSVSPECVSFCHRLFVALSRAKDTIILCEKEGPTHRKDLFKDLGFPPEAKAIERTVAQREEPASSTSVVSKENPAWSKEVLQQNKVGNYTVAIKILEEHSLSGEDLKKVFLMYPKLDDKEKKAFIRNLLVHFKFKEKVVERDRLSFICSFLEFAGTVNTETEEAIKDLVTKLVKGLRDPQNKSELSPFIGCLVYVLTDKDRVLALRLLNALKPELRERLLTKEQALVANIAMMRATVLVDDSELSLKLMELIAWFDATVLVPACEVKVHTGSSFKYSLGVYLHDKNTLMPRLSKELEALARSTKRPNKSVKQVSACDQLFGLSINSLAHMKAFLTILRCLPDRKFISSCKVFDNEKQTVVMRAAETLKESKEVAMIFFDRLFKLEDHDLYILLKLRNSDGLNSGGLNAAFELAKLFFHPSIKACDFDHAGVRPFLRRLSRLAGDQFPYFIMPTYLFGPELDAEAAVIFQDVLSECDKRNPQSDASYKEIVESCREKSAGQNDSNQEKVSTEVSAPNRLKEVLDVFDIRDPSLRNRITGKFTSCSKDFFREILVDHLKNHTGEVKGKLLASLFGVFKEDFHSEDYSNLVFALLEFAVKHDAGMFSPVLEELGKPSAEGGSILYSLFSSDNSEPHLIELFNAFFPLDDNEHVQDFKRLCGWKFLPNGFDIITYVLCGTQEIDNAKEALLLAHMKKIDDADELKKALVLALFKQNSEKTRELFIQYLCQLSDEHFVSVCKQEYFSSHNLVMLVLDENNRQGRLSVAKPIVERLCALKDKDLVMLCEQTTNDLHSIPMIMARYQFEKPELIGPLVRRLCGLEENEDFYRLCKLRTNDGSSMAHLMLRNLRDLPELASVFIQRLAALDVELLYSLCCLADDFGATLLMVLLEYPVKVMQPLVARTCELENEKFFEIYNSKHKQSKINPLISFAVNFSRQREFLMVLAGRLSVLDPRVLDFILDCSEVEGQREACVLACKNFRVLTSEAFENTIPKDVESEDYSRYASGFLTLTFREKESWQIVPVLNALFTPKQGDRFPSFVQFMILLMEEKCDELLKTILVQMFLASDAEPRLRERLNDDRWASDIVRAVLGRVVLTKDMKLAANLLKFTRGFGPKVLIKEFKQEISTTSPRKKFSVLVSILRLCEKQEWDVASCIYKELLLVLSCIPVQDDPKQEVDFLWFCSQREKASSPNAVMLIMLAFENDKVNGDILFKAMLRLDLPDLQSLFSLSNLEDRRMRDIHTAAKKLLRALGREHQSKSELMVLISALGKKLVGHPDAEGRMNIFDCLINGKAIDEEAFSRLFFFEDRREINQDRVDFIFEIYECLGLEVSSTIYDTLALATSMLFNASFAPGLDRGAVYEKLVMPVGAKKEPPFIYYLSSSLNSLTASQKLRSLEEAPLFAREALIRIFLTKDEGVAEKLFEFVEGFPSAELQHILMGAPYEAPAGEIHFSVSLSRLCQTKVGKAIWSSRLAALFAKAADLKGAHIESDPGSRIDRVTTSAFEQFKDAGDSEFLDFCRLKSSLAPSFLLDQFVSSDAKNNALMLFLQRLSMMKNDERFFEAYKENHILDFNAFLQGNEIPAEAIEVFLERVSELGRDVFIRLSKEGEFASAMETLSDRIAGEKSEKIAGLISRVQSKLISGDQRSQEESPEACPERESPEIVREAEAPDVSLGSEAPKTALRKKSPGCCNSSTFFKVSVASAVSLSAVIVAAILTAGANV